MSIRRVSEQEKVFVDNALSRAHTEIHQALHALRHGSEAESKKQALSALKKVAEALALL